MKTKRTPTRSEIYRMLARLPVEKRKALVERTLLRQQMKVIKGGKDGTVASDQPTPAR